MIIKRLSVPDAARLICYSRKLSLFLCTVPAFDLMQASIRSLSNSQTLLMRLTLLQTNPQAKEYRRFTGLRMRSHLIYFRVSTFVIGRRFGAVAKTVDLGLGYLPCGESYRDSPPNCFQICFHQISNFCHTRRGGLGFASTLTFRSRLASERRFGKESWY